MNWNKMIGTSVIVACALCISVATSCNAPSDTKEEQQPGKTSVPPLPVENMQSIPDSTIQFLVTSASRDFHEHQPPTAIDFRNVKPGYILSSNEKMYLLCGEFLSQEKNEWESFTTIKTMGYEQYLGDNIYCQKATMVVSGKYDLALALKNELAELRK